jgi:hypothetical protein
MIAAGKVAALPTGFTQMIPRERSRKALRGLKQRYLGVRWNGILILYPFRDALRGEGREMRSSHCLYQLVGHAN